MMRSESESESEFGTDSDSDSLHKDSEKHVIVRTSDAVSCFTSQQSDITTDENILPNTAIIQSPPAQMMDRNSDSSFETESFSRSGSAFSAESLFSLQLDRNSFTNHTLNVEHLQLEEMQNSNMNQSNEPAKFRQPRPEAKSVGETIERKNSHGLKELSDQVSEGLPHSNHPTSHQNDYVLPLTFVKSMEENTNGKKKKKKKRESLSCFCCSWPSCSQKCLSCSCWPSCSCKWLSCSGCPSCNCFKSCPSCSSKCLSCSGCCKCPSSCCCCH